MFGTVVDWRWGVARGAKPFLDQCGLGDVDPAMFADRWRALYQPSMEVCRAAKREYVPLDVLHAEMLEEVLAGFGVTRSTHSKLDRASFARL